MKQFFVFYLLALNFICVRAHVFGYFSNSPQKNPVFANTRTTLQAYNLDVSSDIEAAREDFNTLNDCQAKAFLTHLPRRDRQLDCTTRDAIALTRVAAAMTICELTFVGESIPVECRSVDDSCLVALRKVAQTWTTYETHRIKAQSICTALGLTLARDIFDAKEHLQTAIAELRNLDLKSLQRSASDLKSALDASAKQSRFLKDFFDQLTKGFNDLLESVKNIGTTTKDIKRESDAALKNTQDIKRESAGVLETARQVNFELTIHKGEFQEVNHQMAQLNNQMEQFKHRVENLTDLENRILIPMVKIAELVSWTSGHVGWGNPICLMPNGVVIFVIVTGKLISVCCGKKIDRNDDSKKYRV